MTFQSFVLRIYPALIKRVYSWILPSVLMILYLSAYAERYQMVRESISRLGLVTIHLISGSLLVSLLIVIIYDSGISEILLKKKSEKRISKIRREWLRQRYKEKLTFTSVLFYCSLFLICLQGLLLCSIRYTSWGRFLPDEIGVVIVHDLFSKVFLVVFFVKYYLAFTKWARELLSYLREH